MGYAVSPHWEYDSTQGIIWVYLHLITEGDPASCAPVDGHWCLDVRRAVMAGKSTRVRLMDKETFAAAYYSSAGGGTFTVLIKSKRVNAVERTGIGIYKITLNSKDRLTGGDHPNDLLFVSAGAALLPV